MSGAPVNGDAPPSYDTAVKSHKKTDSLTVPGASSSGLQRSSSQSSRLSTEHSSLSQEDRQDFIDEHRPLPDGWIMQYDPKSQHHYWVDTKTGRSIWTHPEDDEQYQAEQKKPGQPARKIGLGEKIKNKIEGNTHEERVAARKKRAELERKREQEWLKQRQQRQAQQQAYYQQNGMYAPQGYYQPQAGYYNQGYYPPAGPYRRTGFGGGSAMPLLGGLAGGLLLGDLLF